MRLSNGECRWKTYRQALRGGVACSVCRIKRRVKPMNDKIILSPEMDEELSNGKGEDENE